MHAVDRIDNRQAQRINYWFLLVEEEGVSRYEKNAEEKDYRCTDSRNEDKNESSLVFPRLSRAFKMSSSPAMGAAVKCWRMSVPTGDPFSVSTILLYGPWIHTMGIL